MRRRSTSAPRPTAAHYLIDDYRRLARDKEVIMYVYVIDAENTLCGVVDIRELIMAEKDQTLDQIKTDHVISLDPEDTLSDALALFERYSFRAIPITDEPTTSSAWSLGVTFAG
jgi:Mg/Co/Ni transporter MgtE